MTSRLIFGFEGFVLHTFVAVQSLVLRSFFGIASGVMNIPGLCKLLDRRSPPRPVAGSAPALPSPTSAGVVPARPDVPGRNPGWMWEHAESASDWTPLSATALNSSVLMPDERSFMTVIFGLLFWKMFDIAEFYPRPESPPPGTSANRGARSLRGCSMEAFLSAIVFVYTVQGMAACSNEWEVLTLFLVLSSAFRGAKVGLYHLVNPAYSQRAVDEIVERSGNSVSIQDDGTVSLNLHRVDLFEYADMAALSSIYISALLVIVFFLCAAVLGFASLWNILLVLVLFVCCNSRVLGPIGANRDFLKRPNLEDISGPRPTYRTVRFFLLLSGLAFAGSLCFSPGPFLWRWGLIATHTTRLFNLLVSLRGRDEGRVDAPPP